MSNNSSKSTGNETVSNVASTANVAQKPAEGVYTYSYPHPAVTTDCVVFGFDGKELKVLLIERGIEPYKGMWAFPGGFMRMDETAEECAERELREETGLSVEHLHQLQAFSGIQRDPRERVVTIAFYSLVRQAEVMAGDDAANARWFSINKVPALAFDHDYILRQAQQRLRRDLHFEPVGFGLLDEQFTVATLQRLYEAILGVKFDRRNFYKKILQTGVLSPVMKSELQNEEEILVASEESAPATNPQYLGSRRELKRMNIAALFGDKDGKGKHRKYRRTNDNQATTHPPVGRPAKLFRFNEDGYNRLKEDGGFKIEF